jgi:hypothetical protein
MREALVMKKRTETLRRLVAELPEREAAGHQALISRVSPE